MKYITAILAFLATVLGFLFKIQKDRGDKLDADNQRLQDQYESIDKQIDAGKKRRKEADEAIKDVKSGNTIADINKRMRNYRDGKVH